MSLPFFRCVLACGAFAASFTGAQAAPAGFDEASLRAWLEPQVAATAAREGFTRYEIRLGAGRAAPASCTRVEPFLPAGGRAWGRLSVGLRCVEGGHGTVLRPVTVAVWGPAVVATERLVPGTVLSAQDLEVQPEVELTAVPPGHAREPDELLGRTLSRTAAAGQPLRPGMTRATAVVRPGEAVRLQIVGKGFRIDAGGQAMQAAGEGQPVRVRTDLGKVLTGTARQGRIVEVML